MRAPHPIERSRRRNLTKTARRAQLIMTLLMGLCVPFLLALLVWDLYANPSPVPAVVAIASLVLLCFFFSYVFVVPDDLTSTSTDRTLAIASKIFSYTRHGMTPEAVLGACQIILPETLASAICITDGKQVLASWGEGSDRAPEGTPVTLATTKGVIAAQDMNVFERHPDMGDDMRYFPRMRAGIVAPLIVGSRCVGTLELYYPRIGNIDMRQTALARGFADLISTQLATFELERQGELTARVELRALQSQVDPHFLFNTIGTIVSLVRTEPEKARSLLIDFSNYYRRTLSDSESLTAFEHELEQGIRYINLMQARYGEDRLRIETDVDPAALCCKVPPFILQPLLENCIKHAMRETEPLTIVLSARTTEHGVRIAVADDGLGMDKETQAHLFESHDAADAAHAPETFTADGSIKRGCGLALSNVLQRIRMLFGEESGLLVESRENEGTCVTVELVGEVRDAAGLAAPVR